MTFSNLACSMREDAAIIRLCRPGHPSNALGVPFLSELHSAVEQVRNTEAVKIVVFAGTDRTFSTGADLDEIKSFSDRDILEFLRLGQSLLRNIMELGPVTVAAVNGLALGGGLELALACDIRWAHARAAFGLPEARLGLVPGWGGVELLRPLVPPPVYEQMISGAGFVTARRAYETGLVSRVYASVDFDGEVLSEAVRITATGADFRAEIKRAARSEKSDIDLASANERFLSLWNKPGWKMRLSRK